MGMINRLILWDIYWIDMEGGAATLIITPEQESILMDAGWNRADERDATRIQAAMTDARITGIDYFIASHFHDDHVGGLPALARRVPIKQFIDHGESVLQDQECGRIVWANYLSAAKGKRQTVRPGDKLPLEGVELTFVTSNKEILSRALASQSTNQHCQGALPGDDVSGENSRRFLRTFHHAQKNRLKGVRILSLISQDERKKRNQFPFSVPDLCLN